MVPPLLDMPKKSKHISLEPLNARVTGKPTICLKHADYQPTSSGMNFSGEPSPGRSQSVAALSCQERSFAYSFHHRLFEHIVLINLEALYYTPD